MKLINIAPIVAVSLLMSCSGKEKKVENTVPSVPTVKNELKIAYYSLDSLKTQYVYYKEIESQTKNKQEKFQKELERKQKSYQEYIYSNDQLAKSGQLSENQIAMVQQEAQNKEMVIYQYQQTEGARLENEAVELFDVINKRVEAAGKEYCQKHHIDLLLIYGQGGQINFINPNMDATKEFVAYLNQYQEKIDKNLGITSKKK